jgi:hypothetical protein
MSYRDDHDAAIDRIDALELDLARSEAERERLHAEIAKLKDAPADADRIAALDRDLHKAIADRDRLRSEVERLRARPATDGPPLDVPALIKRFEASLRSHWQRGLWVVIVGVLQAGAGVTMLKYGGAIATIPLLFAAGFVGWGILIMSQATSPGTRDIVDALRDAPERIVALSHTILRGDRIRIATARASLQVLTDDAELFGDLRRRCPAARRS